MQDHDREDGQLDEHSYAQTPRPAPYHDEPSFQGYSNHASSSRPDYSRPSYDRREYEQRSGPYERSAPAYDERHWHQARHYPNSHYVAPLHASHPYDAAPYHGYHAPPAPPSAQEALDAAPVWNGHAPKVGTQMRLVVLQSDVLPPEHKVAIVDARDEGVSVGRDRSFTARIRLPSMSISKHHANLFLMPSQGHDPSPTWSVTDAGSTHGSFHLPCHSIPPRALAKNVSSARFGRLSEAKKASAPRALAHGDWLRFGEGTTFEVHLHGSGAWACSACSLGSDGAGEIPLKSCADAPSATTVATGSVPLSAAAAAGAALLDASVVKRDTSGTARAKVDRKIESEAQRRHKMRQMREHYLGEDTTKVKSTPASSAPAAAEEAGAVLGAQDAAPKYIDRAAARRARNPDGPIPKRWGRRRSASPPAAASPSAQGRAPNANARAISPPPPQAEPQRARAAPLDASNVGFRMLQQMTGSTAAPASSSSTTEASDGSSNGAGIGAARFAAPLVVRGTEGRAGLGSAVLRDAEEIGAHTMGVAWAADGAARGAGAVARGGGAGRGGYGGKEATRRRYEESLAQGAGR